MFEEIAAIESNRAVSQYFIAVLAQGALTSADLEEAADLAARRIDSSGTRADFLIETMSYFLPGRAQEAFFDAVDSMSSSDGRARVLVVAADQARRSPDLREVYRDVVDSISSSDERRRAIAALRRADSEVSVSCRGARLDRVASSVTPARPGGAAACLLPPRA